MWKLQPILGLAKPPTVLARVCPGHQLLCLLDTLSSSEGAKFVTFEDFCVHVGWRQDSGRTLSLGYSLTQTWVQILALLHTAV